MISESLNRVRRHLLLVLLLGLIAPGAFAEAPSGDVALSRTFDDARLQWGPCPEFMPKGCGIAALHGDPAKPNADGATPAISVHDSEPSVLLKMPLWCCTHI